MREYKLGRPKPAAAPGGLPPGVAAAKGPSRLVNLSISQHSARSSPAISATGAEVLAEHVKLQGDLPVTKIKVFRRDVVVCRETGSVPRKFTGRKRGDITEFSFESRMRLLHFAKNCNADFHSMLTATYPRKFPADGRLVKKHLNTFTVWLRREVDGIRGIWFLEFQKRGAPHFHFLLDVNLEDQGKVIKKRRSGINRGEKSALYRTCQLCEDRASAAWYRIVKSGDERHLRAGVCWEQLEESDAALRYAAMHAGKPKQKEVPEEFQNVGRFWGKIGPVWVENAGEMEMSTDELFYIFGPEAMSRSGRVKKFLWDASESLQKDASPEEKKVDQETDDEIPF